jgi:alcohol dehydrogenase (cytochrome c)
MLTRTFAGLLLAAGFVFAADGLDPKALLKPATDTWPTYNGDYSGRRYSSLSQINHSRVGSADEIGGHQIDRA